MHSYNRLAVALGLVLVVVGAGTAAQSQAKSTIEEIRKRFRIDKLRYRTACS